MKQKVSFFRELVIRKLVFAMDFTRSSASFFPSAFALNIVNHFLSPLDLDPKIIYLVG